MRMMRGSKTRTSSKRVKKAEEEMKYEGKEKDKTIKEDACNRPWRPIGL
jgi:hypothetical protein